MENTFTPGPWRIEQARNSPYGPIFRLIGNTPDKWHGENGTIGSLHMNDSFGCDWAFPVDKDGEMIPDAGYNRAELDAEANARLISFAPVMYAKLKEWAYQDNEIAELVAQIEKKEEIKVCESAVYEVY